MNQVVLGIFAAGLLALVTGIVLFAAFRFERFVGVRYLERQRSSKRAFTGLVVSALVSASGMAVFLGARGQARNLETVGVIVALIGSLGIIICILLRIFSVFTTISMMGVVLGVASLVVVLAVTSGFEREFEEKVLAVNAHLIVTDYGLERDMGEAERWADGVMKKLKGMPGLERMVKFSFSAGEVMLGRVGASLKGVDLASDGAPELRRALLEGKVEDLGKPAQCPGADETPGRMILGVELARKTRAKVGQCLSLLVPFAGGKADARPESRLFKVVGIFRMNFHEYDARLAFIPLEDARRLENARQSIVGVELRFADAMAALDLQAQVEKRLGPEPRIIDWKTLNRNLFTALMMQKLIISMVLGFIMVVAAFNIVASLMLIVLSKTREVAILASMGTRRASVRRIFLVAGTFVGFVGTSLGVLFGLAVCGLAELYGYPLDPKVYLIERLPVQIAWQELLFVAAATQLICFLATLYPAQRAAQLPVIEGLRYT